EPAHVGEEIGGGGVSHEDQPVAGGRRYVLKRNRVREIRQERDGGTMARGPQAGAGRVTSRLRRDARLFRLTCGRPAGSRRRGASRTSESRASGRRFLG